MAPTRALNTANAVARPAFCRHPIFSAQRAHNQMTQSYHYHNGSEVAGCIVLVDGDKGGVGKSFTARSITGHLLSSGTRVHCFDGDYRNGSLERHYRNHCAVQRLDLRSEDGFSDFYDTLDMIEPRTVVLCDLPAGAGARVESEAERLRLNRQFGREIIHVWVADPGEDSVRQFKELQFVADPTRTVFIINMRGRSEPERFTIWLRSQVRASFIAAGGHELKLPHMPVRLHDRIALAQAPFLVDPVPSGLCRSDILSLRIFNQQVATELAPLFNLILGASS
ncbi:hypothetical protein GVO57_13550 [Sphingomonas changnyeongensis]|uniref:CobQ/CobB/MinD/ParA nucleotide binding domain-containing protein n=1 Tax=Sphingomonas changnyeongensis TaxID=2698679 RepID=A0A7Z2S8P7_9SPHN|nr:division plane positioning ATPase MipZ [Sphingomonas changnyeongensis]QHL91636.1 hypothetical protein GVO57_13550 [Sphingomonas changnyeongensis]